MNKKLYFTLSMLFILLIALFLWPNMGFAWQDPSCAPPGCNRPQPITVEGGTILTGNTLNVAEGADFKAGDIIINSTGIEIGGKIEANKTGIELKQYICVYPDNDDIDEDGIYAETVCYMDYNLLGGNNTYFTDLVVINENIAVTAGNTLNLSGGNNAIYIHEGQGGPWGYGIYSRAHEATEHGTYTVGVMGVTPDIFTGGIPIGVMGDSSGMSLTGFGVYAVTNGFSLEYYGGQASDAKIALQAEDQGGAPSAGYAGRFYGNTDITLYREGNFGNTFIIKTSGVNWENNILTIEKSNTEGLDNIFIDGDIRIGGYDTGGQPLGTHQICLNDPGDSSNCITDWADIEVSGGGNNNTYKTFNPDNGDSPQAASASDTLNIIDGANINVVGFDGNNNQDSITINVDTTLTDIVQINSVLDDFLYLNGGDAEGVYVYDKLTVDGDVQVNDLTANCANVTTNAQKELTCGIDAVNDADSSASNEIQDLDSVLKVGATSTMDMGTGSIIIGAGETLCINKACLTEAQLVELLKLIP